MRRRPAIAFATLVFLPLALLGYLGARLAEDERALVRRTLEADERARLQDLSAHASATVGDLTRRLVVTFEIDAPTPEGLRAIERREPLVRQTFFLAPDGRLVHPDPASELSASEHAFLVRTRAIWEREAVLYGHPMAEGSTTSAARRASSAGPPGGRGDSLLELSRRDGQGFISWYWEEGLHLLFWRRHAGGGVIGAEVERVVLLSRILARLPALSPIPGLVVLADARGEPVFEWGRGERGARGVKLTLEPSLDFLALESHAAPSALEAFLGRAAWLDLVGGLAAVALVFVLLAVYVFREYTRDLREAAARVGFVTQVSHELKTPLTNIRLYAELLEADVPEDDAGSLRRLGVIVSESQRLTRLINNILTFSRHQRGALELSFEAVDLDELTGTVLAQFGPLLAAKDVASTLRPGSVGSVRADRDAIGQILANLLGNVEKYAAGGRVVEVATSVRGDSVVVTVADRGPGIPRGQEERIFEAFYRLSDRLADGVTGTGLGLTIARELARLHGGDLVLVPSARGACFELTLPGGAST